MVSGSHKTKKTHLLRVVTKLWRLLRHCLFKQRESIELVDVVCGAVGIDDVHESSTRGTRWRVVSLLACLLKPVCLLYLITSASGTSVHSSSARLMSLIKSFMVIRLWRLAIM